jgi:hypothetical protein
LKLEFKQITKKRHNMNTLIIKKTPKLPSLPEQFLPAIEQLVESLGIPRNALASAEDIEHAWNNLPRELREIPEDSEMN